MFAIAVRPDLNRCNAPTQQRPMATTAHTDIPPMLFEFKYNVVNPVKPRTGSSVPVNAAPTPRSPNTKQPNKTQLKSNQLKSTQHKFDCQMPAVIEQ
jgi:hypothetical protein